MLFDMVNLARAVVCKFLRMLYLYCCHPVLKETPVKPMYSISPTVALYTPFKTVVPNLFDAPHP